MTLKVVLLIIFGEIWGIAGQIFYKKAVSKIATPNLRSFASYMAFVRKVMADPKIWLGLIFISCGLAIWLVALAQADLSLAFPVDSMHYLMTLVMANIFLGEKINKLKVIGTLFVIGGIILVAFS